MQAMMISPQLGYVENIYGFTLLEDLSQPNLTEWQT